MSKIKLFCFPYAGGSALIFNKWTQYLDPAIKLIPVELAGRGRRISESLYADADEAIDDTFRVIKNELNGSHYALLGHSMGSMIAYGLVQKIKDSNLPPPLHAFFSGRRAPHVKRTDEKIYHLMDDAEFKKEVIELGGTPTEFFDHPELLDAFLPFLKNDFRIAETEAQDEVIRPLDIDITVFLGKSDDLTSEQCHGWRLHTKGVCNVHYFEGGHFFLHEQTKEITRAINSRLMASLQFGRDKPEISKSSIRY